MQAHSNSSWQQLPWWPQMHLQLWRTESCSRERERETALYSTAQTSTADSTQLHYCRIIPQKVFKRGCLEEAADETLQTHEQRAGRRHETAHRSHMTSLPVFISIIINWIEQLRQHWHEGWCSWREILRKSLQWWFFLVLSRHSSSWKKIEVINKASQAFGDLLQGRTVGLWRVSEAEELLVLVCRMEVCQLMQLIKAGNRQRYWRKLRHFSSLTGRSKRSHAKMNSMLSNVS